MLLFFFCTVTILLRKWYQSADQIRVVITSKLTHWIYETDFQMLRGKSDRKDSDTFVQSIVETNRCKRKEIFMETEFSHNQIDKGKC